MTAVSEKNSGMQDGTGTGKFDGPSSNTLVSYSEGYQSLFPSNDLSWMISGIFRDGMMLFLISKFSKSSRRTNADASPAYAFRRVMPSRGRGTTSAANSAGSDGSTQ